MEADPFQRLGEVLRNLLSDLHQNVDVAKIREKMKILLEEVAKTKSPHLEREARKLSQEMENFLSTPKKSALKERAMKMALHLEQETREI